MNSNKRLSIYSILRILSSLFVKRGNRIILRGAMNRTKIKQLLAAQTAPGTVRVCGWVRTRRDAKGFSLMEVNDGSCLENIQVIADAEIEGYSRVKQITTGAAVSVTGELKPSPGRKQDWEIQ